MTQHKRPKLYPPLALLATQATPILAFAGPENSDRTPKRPAPIFRSTLAPHELRRIVAAIVG